MLHPEQKRIFQTMTPEQKLELSLQLYLSAREVKVSALRSLHPDWPEDRIKEKIRSVFLYART